MKKLLLIFAFVLFIIPAFSQATFFTFTSISAPPYVCQADSFSVTVSGMRSSMAIVLDSVSTDLGTDTLKVKLFFKSQIGPAVPVLFQHTFRLQTPPAAQYVIASEGYYYGQLHRTIYTNLNVCGGGQISSAAENPLSGNPKIYPNPASNFVNIEMPGQPSAKIQLTDLTGRVVKTETIFNTNSCIDISELPKGLYLLNIQSEKGTQTSKIVKQ